MELHKKIALALESGAIAAGSGVYYVVNTLYQKTSAATAELLYKSSNLLQRAHDAALPSSPYFPQTREQITTIQFDALSEANNLISQAHQIRPDVGLVLIREQITSLLGQLQSSALTYTDLEGIAEKVYMYGLNNGDLYEQVTQIAGSLDPASITPYVFLLGVAGLALGISGAFVWRAKPQ